MALTFSDIFKFIFAVIFPPLGVLLEKGCGCDLLINIALTCLGYIPEMFRKTPTASTI
ncbi:plasma membrane proteolipid Pmp3 [Entomortierella lignicola]|nr:plasma membrane proteolipid Pmp3 [Entomortierella lignicola]